MEAAHKFAMDKLGCARIDVGVPTTAASAATPDAKPSASGDNKSGEANLLKVKRGNFYKHLKAFWFF